jgi:UDP-glucuronate decarboxylase
VTGGGTIPLSRIVHEDVQSILNHVGSRCQALNGKRVLVTGGTGFIGSYLLETLAYLNDRVLAEPCAISVVTRNMGRVTERLPQLGRRRDVTFIESDIRQFRSASRAWDYVIHGAASADARVFLEDPSEIMDIIAEGTKVVLNEATAGVESFLFISSGAVYGQQPHEHAWISEDYPGGPDLRHWRSCYGEAKRYAEMLCQVFGEKRKLPVTIARVFAVLGPYQELHSTSAAIDFIRQGLRGNTITIRDSGETERAYCYIADAVAGLFTLLLRPYPGEVFNIGSDMESVSFTELAHRVSRCLGKDINVMIEGSPASGVLGSRYAPDVTRLYVKEGFRPTTGLDEALARTISWMKERDEANSHAIS